MSTAAAMVPEWTMVKSKLKERFSKLTDDSIDSMKNDLSHLTGKLQSAYGYGKEKAESECTSFKTSLEKKDDSAKPASHSDSNSPVKVVGSEKKNSEEPQFQAASQSKSK